MFVGKYELFKNVSRNMARFFFYRKTNIFDNVVYMMEKYADNLEVLVNERTGQLIEEKKKTDALLERMLPRYLTLSARNTPYDVLLNSPKLSL